MWHLLENGNDHRPASKSVVMTKLLGSHRTVCGVVVYVKNEGVCEYYSRTLFSGNVHEYSSSTCIRNRL